MCRRSNILRNTREGHIDLSIIVIRHISRPRNGVSEDGRRKDGKEEEMGLHDAERNLMSGVGLTRVE
jgi:hypothetical protein